MRPARRGLRECILALAFATDAPHDLHASPPIVSGFALVEPGYTIARDNPLDPGDFERIGGSSVELAAIVDAKWQGFTVRLRGTEAGNTGAGGWPQVDTLRALEAQWTGQISERLTATVGKRILSWDPGYAAQPLGFFQAQTVLSDLTDQEGIAQGVPLAALTWLGDDWTISGVVSDDFTSAPDGQRRGLAQWAVRLTRRFDAIETAAVVQQPEGAPPGFGGSLSTAVGDYVSLHASLFAGARRLLLAPNAAAPAPPFLDAPGLPANPVTLQRGNALAVSSEAGVVVTPLDGLTLIAEDIHNANGFSARSWRNFSTSALAERALFNRTGNPIARYQLALDGRALAAGYLRQDYAFVSASYQRGKWSVGQSALIDLNDRSATIISAITYDMTPKWSIAAIFELFRGSIGSEFGLVPLSLQGYVRIRRVF